MKSSLVISGITNMSEGFICISGYDVRVGRYIRPLLHGHHLPESFLSSHHPPISLGSTLELVYEHSESPAVAPHIEDRFFDPSSLQVMSPMSKAQFQDFIASIADTSVEAIFGYEIELHQGQPILPEGAGERSLGAIICRSCKVFRDYNGKPRCDFIDRSGCEYRHLPIVGRDEWVKVSGNYTDIPIRLSLSRLFRKADHCEPLYWMQVSGVIA